MCVSSYKDIKDAESNYECMQHSFMFSYVSVCVCFQRQMILTGCVAFARHVGPTRVEAELLPQCWEQVLYIHCRWTESLAVSAV